MQKIQFEYFRGMEAEQYSFYRVPKVLFTAECFKSLSCEAKVLYGLLLDRMSLSIKNRWFDEKDRVYIVFTVEEIAELLNCGTQKAVKLLKELDTDKGIGLIEKKRLGLGKPNVIYVKNFMIRDVPDGGQAEKQPGKPADTQNSENHNSRVVETTIQEFPESQFKNDENHNSGIVKTTNPEFPKPQFKDCENHISGIVETTIQEFPKSQSNKTDINKTEINETDYSETEYNETDISGTGPIQSNPINQAETVGTMDVMGQMAAYREVIRENISYGCFQYETPHTKEEVDELVELMVEVMVMPDSGRVRIAGEDKPVPVVKSRFMKLTHSHIEYVRFCLQRNTTKVGNIKSYLLTTLYNSALTIDHYYQAEVNHDMYGGG
ncbi:replication initiator protein A [Blautia producta]|nr:replication initiator protein A [Blautia producta]NSG15243.1 replication initiator protein A [Blautia producta]NSJ75436.1 replication initiator protein A [Blautia producta]